MDFFNHPSGFPNFYLLPLMLAAYYIIDLLSFTIRRSTKNIRKIHHWAADLEPLHSSSKENDVVAKSTQYLPGWHIVVGSLPQHLANSALLYTVMYTNETLGYWMVLIAVLIHSVVNYITSWLLKQYCKNLYNKVNVHG